MIPRTCDAAVLPGQNNNVGGGLDGAPGLEGGDAQGKGLGEPDAAGSL